VTSRGRGDGDQPPRPESSKITDDPLLRPASNAGWDDEHPSPPRPPAGTATSGPPAPSVEKPPSTTGTPPPRSASTPPPTSTSTPPPRSASTPPPSTTSAPSPSSTSASSPRGTSAPASTTSAPASTSTGTAPARSDSATSPTPAGEEPLLPAAYHENDLRAAVGASPLSEPTAATSRKRREPPRARRHAGDDDDASPRRPRNRKTIAVAALSITAGLAVAALVFLGHANSERYLLTCEAERAVVEQGRSFPPWGTRALAGEAWRPLKITPETRCQPHETDDPLDLERLYLSMILDQATALLTAREVTKLDDAQALLDQALLLTRPPEHEPANLATERNEHHTEIERMLGDVTYWRAAAKLHDVAAALTDAAKQFDSAAAQHPRHVSDAAAWAAYTRKLAQELHAGPAGGAPSASPPVASPASPSGSATEHPNVPAGVALPVEPAKGSADAPPVPPVPPAPPAPADAGVPTGGVLL